MTIHLDQPIAFIDTETTGTDVSTDRVVDIAIVRVEPDGTTTRCVSRVNPGVPIPAGATKVHGISDDDVKEAPTFKELCRNQPIGQMLKGAALCGHNARCFDVPLLDAEFRRNFGKTPWGDEFPVVIDTLDLFRKLVPHTLDGAVRFFLKREHAGAHSAEADTDAVAAILCAMLESPALSRKASELARWGLPEDAARWVDHEGKLIRNEAGLVCINFGQHEGRTLEEMARKERGYLKWMLGKDFSPKVKQAIAAVMKEAA